MTDKKKSYFQYTNDELKALLKEHKIEIDLKEGKFDRKAAATALEMKDMGTGKADKLLVTDEDGMVEEEPQVLRGDAEDYEKVMFHSTSENDMPYVYMGHNGKAYYAPKEEPIYIPKFLLNSCIKDAVETHEEIVRGADGKKRTVVKKIQRFPYSIVND